MRFYPAAGVSLLLVLGAPAAAWFETRGEAGGALENFQTTALAAGTLAMGSAGDVDGNPAGFSRSWRQEASFTFAPFFEGVKMYSAVFAQPLEGRRVLWTSIAGFSLDDAPRTNELGEETGVFGASELIMKTGYSQFVAPGVAAGAAVKYCLVRVDDYSAAAVSADLGAETGNGDTRARLSLLNAAPAYLGKSEIMPSVRAGLSRYFDRRRGAAHLDVLRQNAFSPYASLKWFLGVSYEYPRGFEWRAGINRKSVSAGFGLNFRRTALDYAVLFHPLGMVHAVTVTAGFAIEPTAAEIKAAEELESAAAERERAERRSAYERRILADEREKLVRERKISAVFLSASRDFGDKKYARAEAKLNEILKIEPRNEEARKLLAEIKAITSETIVQRKTIEMEADYKRGEYAKASENALWILDAQPENEKARIYRYLSSARMLIAERKYTDAKGELFEVIKIQPANSEALGTLRRIQTVMDMEAAK